MELRRIDHHRHAGDVGLGGDEVEELDHRLLGIEQALVHVDVDDLRAVRHLIARHVERGGVIAVGDELAELGRAGDVRALADIHEGDVGREHEGLEARQAHQRRDLRHRARRLAGDRLGDGADMVRRRAAAAADDVDEAGIGELGRASPPSPRGARRRGRIRSAGRHSDRRRRGCRRPCAISWICARISRAPSAQLRPIENGSAWRTECQKAVGVWPDSVRPERSVIVPEIMIGSVDAALGEDLLRRDDRGLGVERVEDRLDEDDLGAAVDQPPHLLGVGVAHLVEGHGAVAGIVHVRRDRQRAVRRADGAGDEAAAAVLLLRRGRAASRARRAPSRFSS